MKNFEDFEPILAPDFSTEQFANDLLKATNSDLSTNEIDIETPIKKINYDLKELESRVKRLINDNPYSILNQIYKNKSLTDVIDEGLATSLQYLDISYKRLRDDVLVPHERAQKLQLVLGKVHQTSNILRDSLIYIHLANKIDRLMESDKRSLTTEKALQLTSLHAQLDMTIQENLNLKSLQVIKALENDSIRNNKKILLDFVVLSLTKECADPSKLRNDRGVIKSLCKSLFILSPNDFFATMHKIVLSYTHQSAQLLLKTINSIKSFPKVFEQVAQDGHRMYLLESILSEVNLSNKGTTLLMEYTYERPNRKYMAPRELYWSKIATTFKKELETSYNRGGPVGKSLVKNKDLIIDTLKTTMPLTTDKNDFQSSLTKMLDSVSILGAQ